MGNSEAGEGKPVVPPKQVQARPYMVTNFMRMTKNISFPSIRKNMDDDVRKKLLRAYIDTLVTKAVTEGTVRFLPD